MALALGSAIPSHGALIPVSAVTASTFYNDLNPIRTINASGITGAMTTEGEVIIAGHDNNGSATTMWHSAVVAAAGQWLSWSFSAPSNLRTIYYWNHNQANLTDRGIQNVNIKISKDNGTTYTPLGDFVFVRASGQPGERCQTLELPTTQTGVTNVRFDIASNFGGNVVGLSEIRFSTLPVALPDPEGTFSSAEGIVLNQDRTSGERVPVNFSWTTTNANSVTISPGIGPGDLNGGASVTPPANADTVYTLSAQGAAKTLNLPATVRTVIGGSASWRYVRFSPVKLRDNAGANSIQLAELDFIAANGDLVIPTTATNPDGNSPAGQEAMYAVDGLPDTKWLDFNRAPLIVDFGANPTPFVDYQLLTAGDAPDRDPVRWTLEGSNDQSNWTLIDNVTAFDYPTPATRGNLSSPIPVPGGSLQPVVSFTGETNLVQSGDPLILRWQTEGATTVTIDHGVGTVTSSGSRQIAPTVTTTYTLTATTPAGRSVSSAFTVQVADFPVKTIAYENFNSSGQELSLLDAATVVSDPRATSDPSAAKRLRINDDVSASDGAAWFRRRQNVGAGFETNFALNFLNFTLDSFGGADGIAFVIQNSAEGPLALPPSFPERGLSANALNITFDSYKNDDEECSATLQVRKGTELLKRVDLAAFP
ncbi:MAG: symbB, partial [Akkermansiaceae bacterium]|nr:symbB [Akkermansiaceae bacterium]